jgi:septum site-determining protein MinC
MNMEIIQGSKGFLTPIVEKYDIWYNSNNNVVSGRIFMQEIVSIKGIKEGLAIILDETADFNAILFEINKKLEPAAKFFASSSIDIKVTGRKLDEEQWSLLRQLILKLTGSDIGEYNPEHYKEVKYKSINLTSNPNISNAGAEEGMTSFYKGTVRSGQLIKYNGNVEIIGDVHPGGEVTATGNIIVVGTLRGRVHAGSKGNKNAFVAAAELRPTQIRICEVIAKDDDKGRKKSKSPEIAYLKDESIYIDDYNSKIE